MVVLDIRGGRPHEDRPVDDLTHRVQVAAFLQVEHLPPTSVGDLANRENASARRIESGSISMSSSMNRMYGASVVFSASYMMRL